MILQPFGKKSADFIRTPCKDDAWIMILEGSVRSSKTVTMIPKLLFQILVNGPVGLGLITGVSKDTIYDNILRDLFDIIGAHNFHYNRQSGDLDLFGKPCKVMGAKDEGSEKYLLGKTIAWAYCDEVTRMPEKFFKQLLNRLSVPGSRLYATTNPDSPLHYLFKEYISDKKKIESGLVKVIHFELDDNPALDETYKRNIRAAYAGVFFQRYILGLWVVAEGAIYKDVWSDDLLYGEEDDTRYPGDTTLNPGMHPVPLYVNYVERWIVIDYGTSNPTCFADCLDDGNNIHVDREYYWDSRETGQQKTDSEYADDLIEFIGPMNDAVIILDPSAASFAAELNKRNLICGDCDNEVIEGIRVTSTALKLKIVRVHRRCKNIINEVTSYAWDEKAAKRGEEKPIKEKDHGADVLRYLCKTKIPQWRLTA